MKSYQTYIFDIDGTLIRGKQVLPGVIPFLDYLRSHNKQLIFATNNPVETKESIHRRLWNLGIIQSVTEIITPIDAIHTYLLTEKKVSNIMAITSEEIKEELGRLGWDAIGQHGGNQTDVSHVIVGMNPDLTYKSLSHGLKAIDHGAVLIGLNPDFYCPTEDGRIPDTGSLLACLELASGTKGLIMGKPTKWMQQSIKRINKHEDSLSIVIGDSPYTDIKLGMEMGMDTLLLNTGLRSFDKKKVEITPTYILDTLEKIMLKENK